MTKFYAHSMDELGPQCDHISDERKQVLTDLGDAFAMLARICGARGTFHVMMRIDDPARFRALGPIPEEPHDGNAPFRTRVIDLMGARFTAFCRQP